MTGWDPCGDIDTHADAALEAADRERKRERENRPVLCESTAIHLMGGGLYRCVLRAGHDGWHTDGDAEWRELPDKQANERAADAEHDNARGES